MLVWALLFGFVAVVFAEYPCGRVFSSVEGVIESPYFPGYYPHNLFCEMEIVAPPNHVIELEAEYMNIEFCSYCSCDYLDIRSIQLNNSKLSLGKYCGNTKFLVQSDTHHVWILFRTDGGTRMRGFRFFYRVIGSPNPRTFVCSNPIPYLPLPPSVEEERHQSSKLKNVQWLVSKSMGGELPRGILALFLAEPKYFAPNNQTGEGLRDRLIVQLVSRRNATIRSQELALYVQALLVTCQDPRDFLGRDLVSELRELVDQPSDFVNPFEVLALCNAGGNVTFKDVERVSQAFDSQHRPFWTDVQALATMALQCLSREGVTVDERTVRDMQDELKKRQFLNGTVDNSLATTGLVVQALKGNDASFDLPSAQEAILEAQGEDGSWGGSVRNAFYLLPALSGRSLLDIGHSHCQKTAGSERRAPTPLSESIGDDFVVQYLVWIGSEVEQGRFWKVRANKESSFYDVIEAVSKMDNAHNVTYQVVDDKPYVRSLLGKEDDPELGIFWFTYVRSANSATPPIPLESSPADILVTPNHELIMWYRTNTWKIERNLLLEPTRRV